MTQLPTAWKLTTPPLIEQMLALAASTVTVAARPEVAVADGVYVAPPTVAAGRPY